MTATVKLSRRQHVELKWGAVIGRGSALAHGEARLRYGASGTALS